MTTGNETSHAMTTARLRLLLVEDSDDDAELIRLDLERAGFEVECTQVETEEAYLAALREPWDIIISDFQMPQFDGLRAFRLFKQQQLDTPFIFVSGALGEERAVAAMRAGARDYLLKDNLARLAVVVRRELAEAASRAGQQRAEEETLKEQRRLAMAVEASGSGVFEFRLPLDRETYVSERCAEIMGYRPDQLPSADELTDWLLERVHPEDESTARTACHRFIDGTVTSCAVETRFLHRDGGWVEVAGFANALDRSSDGRATHVVGVVLDLTDRRKLESQLRQAQKMEAVGRLAGGVAHDFNNLLTAIFSFGSFVLDTLDEGERAYQDMQEVLDAARRAARLTGQLLAFSRRQQICPRVLNINTLVENMDRMLRRMVGEDIDVETTLAPDLYNVRIDAGSFEQIVMNLAVNARDAMPDGGKLTIETANATLGDEYALSHGAQVPPGEYALLSVSDDGVGMNEETQRRIFEPFFTTKDAGTGTGLGLSMCYGIVKQAGGYIWPYSEPDDGTTLRIYLPSVAEIADEPAALRPVEVLQGTETILVAEDDDQLRRLIERTLTKLGYQVITAANGSEALHQSQEQTGRIDLLLTDVVMPEMNGNELVERLTKQRPEVMVLYMSGYTDNAIAHRGVLEPGTPMLQKPFTPQSLALKVREMLDG